MNVSISYVPPKRRWHLLCITSSSSLSLYIKTLNRPQYWEQATFVLEFEGLFAKCYLKWLLLRWQHQRIQAESRPRSTGFITFCPGCTAKVGASLIVFPDLLHFTIVGVRHYQALLFSSTEKRKKRKAQWINSSQCWAFALLWNKLPNDSQLRLNTHTHTTHTQAESTCKNSGRENIQIERGCPGQQRIVSYYVHLILYDLPHTLFDSETDAFAVGWRS